MFEFKILAKDKKSKARRGEFVTSHGKLQTPELAFVATEGEIKSVPKDILPTLPVNLIIVNTFHLWVKNIIQTLDAGNLKLENEARSLKLEKNPASSLQPQIPASSLKYLTSNHYSCDDRLISSNEHPTNLNQPAQLSSKSEVVFRPISTIHSYANFPRPIMSDSGGFQVFSLGFGKKHRVGKLAPFFKGQIKVDDKLNPLSITDEGVTFSYDNQTFLLSPKVSIELQKRIGADIIFAFDECTSPYNSYNYNKKALERTHQWLKQCLKSVNQLSVASNQQSVIGNQYSVFSKKQKTDKLITDNRIQALFAIIQGGHFEDLRKKSAKFIGKQDVPGFGIGGSLGRNKQDMYNILEWVIPHLPDEKPRHLLGIGQVRDIFAAVERGVDLFDCVIPTREARHKVLYTKHGRININKYKNVDEPIDKQCKCLACHEGITLYKLYELYKLKDSSAFSLATIHNIQFYADLMKKIREAIEIKKFTELKEKVLQWY